MHLALLISTFFALARPFVAASLLYCASENTGSSFSAGECPCQTTSGEGVANLNSFKSPIPFSPTERVYKPAAVMLSVSFRAASVGARMWLPLSRIRRVSESARSVVLVTHLIAVEVLRMVSGRT